MTTLIRRARHRPRAALARAAMFVLCPVLVLSSGGAGLADHPRSAGSVRIESDAVDVRPMHEIAVSEIAPGYQESWLVTVVNERSGPVRVGLRAGDLVNDDNGCTRAESRLDDTCDAGGGELGAHLELHVGVPGNRRMFSSPLNEADEGSGQIITVPGGGTTEVLLSLALPAGTGNQVQTDSVGFHLIWRAEAIPGGPDSIVEGAVEVRSAAQGGGDGAHLALTGARLMLLVGLGVALLAAGGGLLVLRRKSSAGRAADS